MKIGKIIIALLILAFLCGCNSKPTEKQNDEDRIIIKYPASDVRESLNGYKEETAKTVTNENGKINNGDFTYYANKKSKKYHLPDCQYAKKISEENIYLCKDEEQLISEGYEKCKVCNP